MSGSKWVEINLDNLASNIQSIRSYAGKDWELSVNAILDGYGHGLSQIVGTLIEHGVKRIEVSEIHEGIKLRKQYKNLDILVVNPVNEDEIAFAIKNNLILSIYDYSTASNYNEIANNVNKTLRINVRFRDMYFCRHHFFDILQLIKSIKKMSNIKIEAIFKKNSLKYQMEWFTELSNEIGDIQIIPEFEQSLIDGYHLKEENSTIDRKSSKFPTRVLNIGSLLYGIYPNDIKQKNIIEIKPVMSLKSKINSFKKIPIGKIIGFNSDDFNLEMITVANVAFDETYHISEIFKENATIIINEKIANVFGKPLFNYLNINIKDIICQVGDIVTLFGATEKHIVWIDEILCNFGLDAREIAYRLGSNLTKLYLKNDIIFDRCEPNIFP